LLQLYFCPYQPYYSNIYPTYVAWQCPFLQPKGCCGIQYQIFYHQEASR